MRTFEKVFSGNMIAGIIVMVGLVAISSSAAPVEAAEPNETDTKLNSPAGSLGISLDEGIQI